MNSLIRFAASIVACVLIGATYVLLTTEPARSQEPSPAPMAEDLLIQRLIELQTELDRLKAAGDDQAAKSLAAELTRARNLYDGEFKVEPSDVPELHAVGVHAGGTAPAGVLKGNDRYTRGYAEINVTHKAAPLVCAPQR